MNDFPWGTVIASLLSCIAGGGGALILSYFKQKGDSNRADKKQDAELKLSETEKAFTIYKEIVTSLKHDIEQLTKSIQEQEKQYLEAREQKAILQGKLDNAETKLSFYEKELADLRAKCSKN
jgi:chromosome segregation ATPase